MSYSRERLITYTLPAITTTASAATYPIRGPKGKTGRVVDIIARCTTTHVLGSTPTQLLVGTVADTDLAANFYPAAMTAPSASSLTDLPGASALYTANLPPDTLVVATTVDNDGTGSPAGVITYDIVINWF